MCAARCTGLPMIDAEYWNELQISQYQSPPVPMSTSIGSVEPLSNRRAALKPPPEYAHEIFFSFSASPIVRSDEGGTAVPALIADVFSAPLDRKPGRVLLIM